MISFMVGTPPIIGVLAIHCLPYFTMKSFCITATNYYKKRYKHYYNHTHPEQATVCPFTSCISVSSRSCLHNKVELHLYLTSIL